MSLGMSKLGLIESMQELYVGSVQMKWHCSYHYLNIFRFWHLG